MLRQAQHEVYCMSLVLSLSKGEADTKPPYSAAAFFWRLIRVRISPAATGMLVPGP